MPRRDASVSPLSHAERAGRTVTTGTGRAPGECQGLPDTKPRGDHSEYFGMVSRVLRAAGRRAGRADPEDLAELVALREDLDLAVDMAVAGLRDTGYSWAQIGAALGITRQSAQERWGR